MKKENKYSSKKFYTVTPVLLLVLMVFVSFLGVHIFRVQYDKNNLQEEIQDYKNYGKYYAMITTDDSADFWQSVYSSAKEEGENSDAYVELFAGNVGTNYSIEERLDIAIASDVDGIILEGEDGEGIRQRLEKAAENGIPVVMVSQDVSDSERISFVGISRYNLGQTYGKEITTLVGQMLSQNDNLYNGGTPLSVMVLIGNEDDSTGQNLLLSGIKEEIAKNKSFADRISIETYSVDDSGAFTAEESIRDIFMGQKSVPDILVCLNEIHTNCVYQAVIDYNRVGRTNIIGYYDSDSILNAVRKDIVFSTISMDTAQMGRYCVTALNDYLDDGYVNDYYTVDTYVVRRDNVDSYMEGESE